MFCRWNPGSLASITGICDFSVDLNTCITLRQYVPAGCCFVAESGIHTAADVARLSQEGIDAILVGEALVKAKNVGQKVRELAGS